MDEVIGALVLILIGILWISYYCVLPIKREIEKAEMKKEVIRKEEESRQKSLQRDKDMKQIMLFAKNNGVDLSELKKKRDNLYQTAVRNCATGVFTMPSTPDTVKAKYSGTIAEYYAGQINKERRQEYNTALERSKNIANEGREYEIECRKVEREILNKLRQIPNSSEYCKMLSKYFDEDKSVLNESQAALIKASFKI